MDVDKAKQEKPAQGAKISKVHKDKKAETRKIGEGEYPAIESSSKGSHLRNADEDIVIA